MSDKEQNMKKQMRCKGQRDGQPCKSELCETDGTNLIFHRESGKDLIIKPRKTSSFGVICDECGYETIWSK